EVEWHVEVGGEDLVTLQGLAGGVDEQRLRRATRLGHQRCGCIDALVTDDLVVVRVAQLVTNVHHAVSRIGCCLQIGDVDLMAATGGYMLTAESNNVGSFAKLLVSENRGTREKRRNSGVRNRRNGPVQRRAPQARVEPCSATLLKPNHGLA